MLAVNCPACGAKVNFQSAASILAVCEYCRSTLVRHDLNLENVGRMAELQEDGSPIQLRVEGKYRNVHFAVVGRIQLKYGAGFWNEWHLVFDDMRSGWLGESQGNYAISFLTQIQEQVPAFDQLQVGQRISLAGQIFTVINKDSSYCVAGEGELPFRVGAGYEAPVIDLTGDANRFATLDYSEESPLVFLGENLDFEQLQLSGLREFDGW
jgi:hypothetical protein